MKKEILMSCLAAAMMASCSSDEELSNTGEKFNGNVTLTAEPYTFDDGDTRTTLTNTGSKIAFAWDDEEAIGIFPIAPTTNIQAKQVLKNGSGNSTTSSFDGAGWALLYGNTYATYYPFNPEMKLESTYKDVPIDMTGQIQNGDNNLDHIGAGYDYMYAVADVPTNGNVNFDFKHVTSIMMLKLSMPVAATWKSITLTNTSGVFVTSATMNVQDGTVTSKDWSTCVTLALNNVITTDSKKEITLYVAVLPTEIGTLSLTATTNDNESYCASVAGKTLEAGKAYRFSASFNTAALPSGDGYENGYAYVDLNLPSRLKWATMNVGALNATGYGNYYALGETEQQPLQDNDGYNNITYSANRDKYRKYRTNSEWWGTVDNKTTLDPEDDAAVQNWGGAWRMPTHAEQEELVNNCYWVWASNYNGSGVDGYIAYAAKAPYDKGQVVPLGDTPSSDYSLSDSHIFLPAAGYCGYIKYMHSHCSFIQYICTCGEFWSSSLYQDYDRDAFMICFNCSSDLNFFHVDDCYSGREFGASVRAVCE